MSSELSAQRLEDPDLLYSLVKDLPFLKYKHSIEQIKPSRIDFPAGTGCIEVCRFSEFGLDCINDFLHIGLVNVDTVNSIRILLLVWPQFVSPSAYEDRRNYLPGVKKVKTMVFCVPESVFLQFSQDHLSLNGIVAATAILAPVEEWKLLERMAISSFYHLTFDKPGTDIFGNAAVWKHFPVDKLDLAWKRILFICCGPPAIAYVIKRMIKRNWARLTRLAVSIDEGVSYENISFIQGDLILLLIQWSKFKINNEDLVSFSKRVNSTKPILEPFEIFSMVKVAFAKTVTISKRFRCQMCPYETDSKQGCDVHMRLHTGEKPFSCEVCGMSFRQYPHLTRHNILHTGVYPFHCEYCGKPFSNYANLKVHISAIHKSDQGYKCYSCKMGFKNNSNLKDHVGSHSNDAKFQCTICSRRFDAQSKLSEHSRVHSDNKQFKCDICQKGFLRVGALRVHLLLHTGAANFDCEFCGKSFKVNGTRKRHLINSAPK